MLGQLEHGVIEDAVVEGVAGDEGADAAAAAERLRIADAAGAAGVGVALPHEIGFGLGVDFRVEAVLPGRDDVVEIVVPGQLAVGVGPAENGVVDVVEHRVKGVVIVRGDPAPGEKPGRRGSGIPGGHVRARLNADLNHVLVVEPEGRHDAGLRVGVVGEQQRMAAHVVVGGQLRFDVRTGDPSAHADHHVDVPPDRGTYTSTYCSMGSRP